MKAGRKSSPPVRKREFRVQLNDDFHIVVRYELTSGQITDFATILVRQMGEKATDQICRYDSSHGFAHIDLLDREGNVLGKRTFIGPVTYKQALAYALRDLKTNYRQWWKELREDA